MNAIGVFSILRNRSRHLSLVSKYASCSTVPRIHFLEQTPDIHVSSVLEQPNSFSTTLSPAQDIKKVEIKTCGRLFTQWKQERRFWKVPNEGITLSVSYQDTGCTSSTSHDECPLVLIMPGSPSSFEDYSFIARSLRKQGVRVVVPSFPDFSVVKMGRFRHTPEEKCEYIKDFMKTIDIKRVDMLICHSSSLFPGLLLCNEERSTVKALTLLNPTGFKYPKVLNPLMVTNAVIRLAEFPLCYELTLLVGKGLVQIKPALKGNNFMGHILSALSVHSAKAPQRVADFQQLLEKENFPLMMFFSENDGLISKSTMYDMAQLMLPKSDIQFHDAKGEIKKSGGANSHRKVLAFEKGTHFVFKKHPQVVVNEIQSFLFHHFKKC